MAMFTRVLSSTDTHCTTAGKPWDGAFMLVQECIVPKGARDPVTNVVQPDPAKFPHGLANLAAYFHDKGLRAGQLRMNSTR